MYQKIISGLVLFVGEAVIIYAEVLSARMFYAEGKSFWQVIGKVSLFGLVSTFMLLCGYMFGLRAFKNIWIVTVISVTSILVAEPLMTYFVSNQTPTKGAYAGLILGFIGLILTLTWK